MNSILVALISWACGAVFGYSLYDSLRTGKMSFGALDGMNFTREERPVMFWWGIGIETFGAAVGLLGGLSALLNP